MEYRSLPALFVADAPGLDFLNSVATPVDEPVDWLADGEGLLSWLEQASLVPADVLAHMRSQIAPAELDEVAAKARGLREWFRSFVQKNKGRPLAAKDLRELEALNSVLKRDEQHGMIVADASAPSGLAFTIQRRYPTAESLLMPIVEALAKLVCEEDFTYVKACEGPTCTLLFADHTRGHARRWCSMASCGNRAKVAAHRARLREGKGG
ncbi:MULTISPECIES: ABATE domain-containing protein [unclassified Caballeronia]|uniref:CGNR zinc finger domain-containing protein n=1 Tax=unclassified Caballeronia TaxID=2646786 RepID=UPI0028593339|nr:MULTISPECIES: ABATE domain-containing protein [unclassified Caballeronia]MDR5753027.1 CGNR zinc finger domain-containing protein [Caballeronia sp. LZ024]MDR5845075.1 CGNR zinc finger domain-containing protein [Caballeronia sp. LZ031]